MPRQAQVQRNTAETRIDIRIELDGNGDADVKTGLPFFDHMLTLFSAHGFFNTRILADGDLEVDAHHTVEDVGLVLGDTVSQALGDRRGIRRYGHAVTPMDDALAMVSLDLSNRPFLVFNLPQVANSIGSFDPALTKEFFRAFATRAGMNLHINVPYGENDHHVIEACFKALGRALAQAISIDSRITHIRSTKGVL